MSHLSRRELQRSEYNVRRIDHGQRIVFIVDAAAGARSVTNDAENVVRDLYQDYPGYRIVYRDTAGKWDEIVYEPRAGGGFRFLGFTRCPDRSMVWGGL